MSGLPLVLALLLAAGASPLEVEHLRSREARERIAAGAPAQALPAYQALERELGPLPAIEVGRGAALLKLDRHAEARQAFGKARQAPEPLGSRALLGLGNALCGTGELSAAAAAYREALERDPAYADARHNLELVLRRQQQAAPPQAKPGPSPRPGEGAARDPGAGPPGQRGQGPAPQGDDPAPAPAPDPSARPEPADAAPSAEAGERGARADGQLTRREAERLLDALRAREPNLPPEAAQPRGAGRRDALRDW